MSRLFPFLGKTESGISKGEDYKMQLIKEPPATLRNVMRALGLVFGDIGTSPIYTFNVILLTVAPTHDNIIGIISLFFWTLITVVTGQYAWLAMSEANRGEGGPMVLRDRLGSLLRNGHKAAWLTFMLHLALGLMLGDGVITPAISILSAVEGISLVPGLEGIPHWGVLVIAMGITLLLFKFQKHGADRVSDFFGPIVVLWFVLLFTSGLVYIHDWKPILLALNPLRGISFLIDNASISFIILSQVLLCATGGEALYSDIGHVGRRPIRVAWAFVFVALVINYLGQGAFMESHPFRDNILFHLFQEWLPVMYVPCLILTCLATIIASQAVISSVFSVIYQVMGARLFPTMRVVYTSLHMRTQIYLPAMNWILFGCVVATLLIFQSSAGLADAYGLAVMGTMTITAIFLLMIFWKERSWVKFGCACGLLVIDATFLLSTFSKIPTGGYWSLILAMIPLGLMRLYAAGSRRIHENLRPMAMDDFVGLFKKAYPRQVHLPGEGLYATRSLDMLSPYIMSTMFANQIMYTTNIICQVRQTEQPYGQTAEFLNDPAAGLRLFRITVGYKEVVDLGDVFSAHGIQPNAIFYGAEEIVARQWPWTLYAWLRKTGSSWVQFYRLPMDVAHGVMQRVQL